MSESAKLTADDEPFGAILRRLAFRAYRFLSHGVEPTDADAQALREDLHRVRAGLPLNATNDELERWLDELEARLDERDHPEFDSWSPRALHPYPAHVS